MGLGYDEIADRLETTVGAVCGKVSREGIGRGKLSSHETSAFIGSRPAVVEKDDVDPLFLAIMAAQAEEAERRGAITLALEDAEDHHCSYVIGDPSRRRVCGVARLPGLSYCQEHADRCKGVATPLRGTPRSRPSFGVWGLNHRVDLRSFEEAPVAAANTA